MEPENDGLEDDGSMLIFRGVQYQTKKMHYYTTWKVSGATPNVLVYHGPLQIATFLGVASHLLSRHGVDLMLNPERLDLSDSRYDLGSVAP